MIHAIETRALGYRAGRDFVLHDVHLHVPAGAIYGFLGANGAGKTTTIRLLMGLLRPERGSITVLGEPVPARTTTVLARTGYVPERPHLHPTLTVQESLDFHRAFFRGWDDAWAAELLARFDLPRDRTVSRLSKGETGKLLMLLALAQRPELLVLDEPTDGLDPVVRRDVLEALLEYVADSRATVLVSSHLVHELERICDWVGVMDRGAMVAELPMHEMKAGLRRLRVAGWSGAAPPLDAPFTVLAHERTTGAGEEWLVRNWADSMRGWLEARGVRLLDVRDLDLEEGFVELLRSFRRPAPPAAPASHHTVVQEA
jgi:ABC-2 type transport system ATP-binding protein